MWKFYNECDYELPIFEANHVLGYFTLSVPKTK